MPRTTPQPEHRPFVLDFTPLRQRRRYLGITAQDLARAVGVHRITVYRTELNRTSPTADQLVGYARALGVPMTSLFNVVDQ